MDRHLHDLMIAQYATPKASGNGLVSWDNGVKCVLPSAKLYGAAVQDGTPTPDAPIMPVCNDGVVKACGRNLCKWTDFPEITLVGYIRIANLNAFPTIYKENTQYTFSVNIQSEDTENDFGIYVRYTDESYAYIFVKYRGRYNEFITTAAGKTVKYIEPAFNTSFSMSAVDAYLYEGTTPTPYTPYYDGGQATAPELWAIPGTDIRDEWDAQTGWGVRRVHKCVINGQDYPKFEGLSGVYWNLCVTQAGGSFNTFFNRKVLCSHWKGLKFSYNDNYKFIFLTKSVGNELGFETVDDLNAFCHEQYLAGTPVTVYGKCLDTPFYHPPASLTMPRGYGQIIQTSGSVPDCPLEARYLTHAGGAK